MAIHGQKPITRHCAELLRYFIRRTLYYYYGNSVFSLVSYDFASLHTFTEPAIREAIKTLLSYRNDTIISFFFVADKNKDNAKIALASSNS